MALKYIATGGSNGAAGDSGTPWATADYAFQHVSPGDTILAYGGIYNQNIYSPGVSGSAGLPITLTPVPGQYVEFAPVGLTGYTVYFFSNERYLKISGIVINGIGTTYGPAKIEAYDLSVGNPGDIDLDGCVIFSDTSSVATPPALRVGVEVAATLAGTRGHNTVQNCTIYHCTAYAIYCSASTNTFYNNNCYDVNYGGIHLSASYPGVSPDNNVVDSNYVHDIVNGYDNRFFGIITGSGGPTGNLIKNNVIARINGADVNNSGLVAYTGTNNLFYYNTITECSGAGIAIIQTSVTGTQVIGNISYANAQGNYYNIGTSTVHTTNVDDGTNPLFTDAASSTYTLLAGSPAINAGTTEASVPVDILGVTRPQGPAYCIGAYEFVSGGGGPWSVVAQAKAGSSNTVSVTTSAVDTSTADLIIINVGWYSGISAVLIVTDSKGNLYTPLTAHTNASSVVDQLFYCPQPITGSGHTFTATGGDAIYPGINVLAVSGSAVAPFGAESAGGTATAASTIQPGSLTPAADNALMVTGVGWDGDSAGVSVNQSFVANVLPFAVTFNEGAALAYLVLAVAAAKNPTWNLTTSLVDGMSASQAWFATATAPSTAKGQYYNMAYGGG